MARENCCAVIHLKEDNARFVLLILFLVAYILIGAAVFSAVERSKEHEERQIYKDHYDNFVETYITNGSVLNESTLKLLLENHSYAYTKGITDDHRPRWDFPGAFYFVSTVVSTIGFGMTSPSTLQGRVLLICYGLPGCAACILFYNIFLERLITFLAIVMKACHERKIRKLMKVNNGIPNTGDGRRPSQQSDDNLDSWKPSVYYVLLYLMVAVTIITCCASGVYTSVETEAEWTYFDSVYFCFVAFSTIGFGDYVSSQKDTYPNTNMYLYRFANFLFLTAGVCCIYSLYNVMSIIIKQLLTFCLKKLDCRCCHRRKPRPRRNAITPGQLRIKSGDVGRRNNGASHPVEINDLDSNYDSETDGRRMSGEMISMKDFLAANKVSLAVMQKQLYETSGKTRGIPGPGGHVHHHHTSNGAFGGGIGGIAMITNKIAESDKRE